jgi:nitrate reductase gamma subunit
MQTAWFISGPLCYGAGILFLAGLAWRTWRLVRLPRHIRWEMYPLPRDGAAGSKYQQVVGTARPRHAAHWAELRFMAQEILLLKKVFVHGRRLWPGSFALHTGLYLCVLAALLVTVESLLRIRCGAAPVGAAGVGLGLAGTLYLLALRLADGGLRRISDTATYFHLLLVTAMFAAWLVAGLSGGNLAVLRAHLAGLLGGRPAVLQSPALLTALAVTSIFLVYLPWSRMFHVVAKYFFYHAVLWEDEALRPGSRLERELSTYLGYSMSWSAEHLRPPRTWAEQAAPPSAGGDGP